MTHFVGFMLLACLTVVFAQYSSFSPRPQGGASGSTYSRASYGGNGGSNGRIESLTPYNGATGGLGYHSTGSGGNGFNGLAATNGGVYGGATRNGGAQSTYGHSGHTNGLSAYNGAALSQFGAGAIYGANGFGLQPFGGFEPGPQDDFAQPSAQDPDADSIVGEAGRDYPVFSEVPPTSFDCAAQGLPGLFADPEAQCQVFHICQAGGHQDSFLCPNGSIFNQQYFVCDWWHNVDCSRAMSLYGLNAELYNDPTRYSAAQSYAQSLHGGLGAQHGGYGGLNGGPVINGIHSETYSAVGQNGIHGPSYNGVSLQGPGSYNGGAPAIASSRDRGSFHNGARIGGAYSGGNGRIRSNGFYAGANGGAGSNGRLTSSLGFSQQATLYRTNGASTSSFNGLGSAHSQEY